MTTEIEAQPGYEASLRAYNMNQRLTALNSLECSKGIDGDLQLSHVLTEIDGLIINYDRHDPIQNKLLNQMQLLDSVFHKMIHSGIRHNSDYFKLAFFAQKLFTDSARLIEEKKQNLAMMKD